MSGGILGHLKPDIRLVDEDFVPSPLPGTSLYGQPAPIPVAEYWKWVFQRNDPAELERLAAAYAMVTPSIGPAHDREETAAVAAPAAPNVPEGTQPPAEPENAPTGAPAASPPPPDDGEAA